MVRSFIGFIALALPGPAFLAHAQLAAPESDPIQGARMPALSPDGSQLAYVYRGDIWISDAQGGRGTPLTQHLAIDAFPMFSPDGQWVAFTSKRQGGWDIYAIPVFGGEAKQMTYHGGSEIGFGWSPDGSKILYATRRDAPNYGLFSLDVNTLQNELLCEDFATMNYPSWSPDGRRIVYGRYGFHWTRPRYHGSAAAQIWVLDVDQDQRRAVTDGERQHLWTQFLPDSEHLLTVTVKEKTPSASTLEKTIPKIEDSPERTPNLWRFDLEGRGEQLTFFEGNGVRWPSVAMKTGDVAFEYGPDLWILKHGQDKPVKLRLFAAADAKQTTRRRETLDSGVGEAEPSPDGKIYAFGLKNDIWTIQIDKPKGVEGRTAEFARRLTEWVGEDSDFSWSHDGKKIYFISDRDFNSRVFEVDVDSGEVTPIWKRMEDVTGLRLSPDGKQLAFWVSGLEGGLWLWTLETGESRRLVKVPGPHWRGMGGGNYSWSPDMKWMAYTFRGQSRAWNIWIVPVDSSREPVNVTQLYAHHSMPTWSPDGRFLFFQSNRDGNGLYVLPLTREEIRVSDTDLEFVKPTNSVEVVIEFEDISRRIRKVASESPQGDLTVTENGDILFLSQGDVWKATYDGKTVRRLSNGGGKSQLRVSDKGRKLYYIEKGELHTMSHEGKGEQKVSFTADWERDVREERQAAFTQFWRSYHRGYYDPNFHGRNWERIRVQYEPLLDGVETDDEFATLLGMMVGELDTSHAEVKPGSDDDLKPPVTPHLGFTFDYAHNGPGIKVAEVPQGTPAWYPKTRIEEGEYVLAINGEDVTAGEDLYERINGRQGREFEFLVHDKPEKEGARKVRYEVLSTKQWADLRYENRVSDLRDYVDLESRGQVGYVHISAMGSGNQDQFEKEIYEYMVGREAMIIDVRFNTGGNISDNLIDWLERKPHGYFLPRDGEPEPSPYRAWDKPIVVVMNEHSYSNAEMFPYAMRTRGLARLVGQPTPGYVIWTSDLRLVDGTRARMPQSGVYRLDGTTQENNGEMPDYLVPLTPEDWLAGRDPQIDKAIELLVGPREDTEEEQPAVVAESDAKPRQESAQPGGE